MRPLPVLAAVALVAACSGQADPAPSSSTTVAGAAPVTTTGGPPTRTSSATSTTTPVPTTTTSPATTTTTTAPPPTATQPAAPVLLEPPLTGAAALVRYGPSGAWELAGAEARSRHPEPLTWATPDHMGGLLVALPDDPDLHWLKAGASTLERLPYRQAMPAVIAGHPSLITYRFDDACDDGEQALLVDLATAVERPLGCFGGEDGSFGPASGGGDHMVGTSWMSFGSNGTARMIHFFDSSGAELDHPFNPVAETCQPCELFAMLSPDGSRLAYQLRPDAKWSDDRDRQHELDLMSWEEWWDASRSITGAVVVVDLATGVEVFRTAVEASSGLADFDGRHLVVTSRERAEEGWVWSSLLIDTAGEVPPQRVPGSVLLQHRPLAPPPDADIFRPPLIVWVASGTTVAASSPFRFDGETQLDATLVAAGGMEVPVDHLGGWHVDLDLDKGPNEVQFLATDPAGNTTEVRATVICCRSDD